MQVNDDLVNLYPTNDSIEQSEDDKILDEARKAIKEFERQFNTADPQRSEIGDGP